MSTALRIANAVCEAQLRAKAQLIALGTPEDMIEFWSPRGTQQCGLTVAGVMACEVFVWDTSVKCNFQENAADPLMGFLYKRLVEQIAEVNDETIIVRVSWCGDGPEHWVPSEHVIEYWRREMS